MSSKIEFKRGDGITHYFVMPTSSWTAGGKLMFTAKPAIDDDLTDANATINTEYTDTNMVNDGTNVTYTCYFPPAVTNTIASNGATRMDYLAEFQYVTPTGIPTTFPGNDSYLDAIVYFDVRRSII